MPQRDIDRILSGILSPVISRSTPHRYEVGKSYPIQPGKYKRHVAHVRVDAIESATVAELAADGWTFNPPLRDDLRLSVIRFTVTALCPERCSVKVVA